MGKIVGFNTFTKAEFDRTRDRSKSYEAQLIEYIIRKAEKEIVWQGELAISVNQKG